MKKFYLLSVLFLILSDLVWGEQWPTYHQNFQRTGVSSASIDPKTLTLDWFFQPGVGNPLNPGTPNGTGLPIFNGGQSAVIGFGKVFYVYNDNLDQDVLVCLDASIGGLFWSYIIRAPGLGAGAIQSPTVALRTVDAVTDTVVYVGGTNNSFRCVNANTGALIWNRTGLSGNIRDGCVLFDTLVITMDNSTGGTQRKVTALNIRNGNVVWTSASLLNHLFLGPTLSNDTVFVAGRGTGISGDGGGQINAVNAHTGAVIATYDDSLAINYQNGVVVFGDNLVASTRNDGTSLGSTSSTQVWHNTHDLETAPAKFTSGSFGLNRFSTPEVYVEPSVGETVIVYGTADTVSGFGTGAADIVMYRILPSFSFRSSISTVGAVHGPGAVAGGNGLLLQGDDAGYWYALDGNSYGAAFAGLGHFWHKIFPSHITAGAAISPEDDTLVVIIDGNGNCYGWRSGGIASRPRVETYFDTVNRFPITEVLLNIIPPDTVGGTGGSDETTLVVFENVGSDFLSYDISWTSDAGWLSINDLNGGVASPGQGITLKLTAINPDSGFGDFYGEIKLFNTNEPDVDGSPLDTTRMLVHLKVSNPQQVCTPGDFNGSGNVTLFDLLLLRNYLFSCGPAPTCLPNEANGNCELDFGDAMYLSDFIFKGGPTAVPFCSNPDTYSDPGSPDTVKIGAQTGCTGDTVDVPVYITNDDSISVMIPLRIDTTKVICDSVITAGTRGSGIISAAPKYCKDQTGILLNSVASLEPGSGIVAYLRCRIKNGASGDFVKIDSTFLDPNKLRFFKSNSYSIKPVFISGGINIDCPVKFNLTIRAFSPVDLVVTEPTPEKDSLGRDSTGGRPYTIFNTIQEGSSYDNTLDVSVPPDGEKDIVVSIPLPHPGTYQIRVVPKDTGHFILDFQTGNNSHVVIADSIITNTDTSIIYQVEVLPALRGDVNKSGGNGNLVDIIYLKNYIFGGGPRPDPLALGNVNCDYKMDGSEKVDIVDLVYMVNFVFKMGIPPCS